MCYDLKDIELFLTVLNKIAQHLLCLSPNPVPKLPKRLCTALCLEPVP